MTRWVREQEQLAGLSLGYFGASTGAAAALSAARDVSGIGAVVCRGGRTELAWKDLPLVKAPTLLIVGHLDTDVLHKNKKAFEALHCRKKLEIVDGASHLFAEPGAMEKVCVLAEQWFEVHLHALELQQ
jgi:putative phosphoribosyl transferase